jgi:AraC-like DNA-binding protein
MLHLFVVTAGRLVLAVDGRAVTLGEATLCWIFPGQRHEVLTRSTDLDGCSVVAEDPGLPVEQVPHQPLISRLSAADMRWIYDRLQEIEHEPVDSVAHVGLAYVLLRAWRAGAVGHDPRPRASNVVLQAARLLDEPPDGTVWSATRLARSVGISPGHLARRFRSELGCTPTDYRLQGQLNRYLDISDDDHSLSITDAAYSAGFGSYAQFHRIFVRLMKTTPSEHRARRRGLPVK